MGGRAIGAGGGGPHMAATDLWKRTYLPGPLTLRGRRRSASGNRGNLTPYERGGNESRKTTEKAAGAANKEHVSSGYGRSLTQ